MDSFLNLQLFIGNNDRRFSDDKASSIKNADSISSDAALLDAYSSAVIGVVQAIGPAVVSINVGWRVNQQGMEEGSAGSGVIFAPDGYILTNSHVVHEATSLRVVLDNQQSYEATLVGNDPATDLAVIQVHSSGLPFAVLGNSSSLKVGQLAIAIGNPFGFQSTVSTGVVSALGRHWRTEEGRLMENIVQHTAPLNPGNSGGPLLDSQGRVVGINMAMIKMAQGLSFSIPSDTAQWVVSQILMHGRVRRAYLGIAGRQRVLDQRRKLFYHLDNASAVEVAFVESGSPAYRAGLHEGDLIIAVDEQKVEHMNDFHHQLALWPIGRPLTLTIIHGVQIVKVSVVPTEAP